MGAPLAGIGVGRGDLVRDLAIFRAELPENVVCNAADERIAQIPFRDIRAALGIQLGKRRAQHVLRVREAGARAQAIAAQRRLCGQPAVIEVAVARQHAGADLLAVAQRAVDVDGAAKTGSPGVQRAVVVDLQPAAHQRAGLAGDHQFRFARIFAGGETGAQAGAGQIGQQQQGAIDLRLVERGIAFDRGQIRVNGTLAHPALRIGLHTDRRQRAFQNANLDLAIANRLGRQVGVCQCPAMRPIKMGDACRALRQIGQRAHAVVQVGDQGFQDIRGIQPGARHAHPAHGDARRILRHQAVMPIVRALGKRSLAGGRAQDPCGCRIARDVSRIGVEIGNGGRGQQQQRAFQGKACADTRWLAKLAWACPPPDDVHFCVAGRSPVADGSAAALRLKEVAAVRHPVSLCSAGSGAAANPARRALACMSTTAPR